MDRRWRSTPCPPDRTVSGPRVSLERNGIAFEDLDVAANDGSTDRAQAVIVATGKRPRPLGVPGEEGLRGRGIIHCSMCDGPLFAGQRVAVVGGGNSALEAADDLLKIASHVDLVSLTPIRVNPSWRTRWPPPRTSPLRCLRRRGGRPRRGAATNI